MDAKHQVDSPLVEPTEEPPNTQKDVGPSVTGTVGSLIVAGSFWLLIQTIGSKAVTLAGQLVLAWLLSPEDFGEIAMAYTVLAFVTLLINPGIDVILIQRGRRFHLWSTPAFYFSVITGLLGCVAMLAAAPVVAYFYKSPQLVGLLSVLAIATPIGSLMIVPTAKLRSQMRFGALSMINFLQSFLQMALTVAFAAANFGVYSFVLPMPLVYATVSIALWSVALPKVHLRRPLQYWQHLVGDSAYIFAQRLLVTLVVQGDYIVLGALFGAATVGPYFFAYGFAVQAIRLTAGPMQSVLMAGLTQFTAHSSQQTRAALRATKSLVLLGMPLCMLQAAVTRPFLEGIYGDKWLAAIPLVQLISIGTGFDVASWPACSLLQSRGQFRTLFMLSGILAPTFFAFIITGAMLGESFGVAMALCIFYAAFSPMLVSWIFRSSQIGWSEIASIYTRPILVGVLTAGVANMAIRLSSAAGLPQLLQCGFAGAMGLAMMGLSASLLAPAIWMDITARLTSLIRRLLVAHRPS